MSKPIAVLISDIHYSLPTLELADAAMRQAIAKANELEVPLIVAGDLHDTKANMRAECVNAMLETFRLAKTRVYILRGNHDQINERSSEHSLNFLDSENVQIVDYNRHFRTENSIEAKWTMIPYHHDTDELKKYLRTLRGMKYPLIMHQGIQGSNSGDYIQDKSAITPQDVAGFRVISGHYHTRQTIDLPDGGKLDYIGNPYTLNFGEANDPEKGFQILMDDGSLEFVPTNLRKHVVITAEEGVRHYSAHPEEGDLVLIKAKGSKEWLSTQTREVIAKQTGLKDFRLELTPTDSKVEVKTQNKSKPELLDAIIDATSTTPECKTRLKQTWRDLIE